MRLRVVHLARGVVGLLACVDVGIMFVAFCVRLIGVVSGCPFGVLRLCPSCA